MYVLSNAALSVHICHCSALPACCVRFQKLHRPNKIPRAVFCYTYVLKLRIMRRVFVVLIEYFSLVSFIMHLCHVIMELNYISMHFFLPVIKLLRPDLGNAIYAVHILYM